MNSEPNDTKYQNPVDQPGVPRTEKEKENKEKDKFTDEETPITVSGGSITISSTIERDNKDGKKHKVCKIKDDDPAKKWRPVRLVITDDDGSREYSITGEEITPFIQIYFRRPL